MKKTFLVILILATLVVSSSIVFALADLDEYYKYSYWQEGDRDPSYNCFAYVIGVTDEVLWPFPDEPANINDVDRAMEIAYGYERVSSDGDITAYGAYEAPGIAHFGKIEKNSSVEEEREMISKLGPGYLIGNKGHDPFKSGFGALAARYKKVVN